MLSSSLIDPDHAPKQTLEGRRKRLKLTLRDELAKVGWKPGKQAGRFERETG